MGGGGKKGSLTEVVMQCLFFPFASMCEFEQLSLQFFCSPSEDREWYAHWQKRRLRWWKRVSSLLAGFLWEGLGEELLNGATSDVACIDF